ncbi:MAG: NAD(P)H-binding protein [Actinomycetota bacterium]|nr:NAD(P)H-binding protein [Actinomycetota bacterium]
MNTQTVLVVGGTGMLGERVARQLLRDGFEVRLLVRELERARTLLGPAFDYFAGDVDTPDTIERALEGCVGVRVSLRGGSDLDEFDRVEHRGTARVAKLAARQGISRLTYLSGMLVAEDAEIPADRAKFRAELAIHRSGVPYTIFKPTYFMETLTRHVQGRLAIVLGRQPHPLHMVAASDFAQMVSRSFRTPEAANRTFFVHGPEATTIPDALRLYCSLVEPGKRVVSMPLGLMSLVDALFMRGELRSTLQLMKVMQQVGERGDPSEANEVLGAPATTLRRWCEQQRTRDLAERRVPH